MIALVRPWLCAIARNVAPSACRPGIAKDVFDAPQVVLTPSSSRSRCNVAMKAVDGARLGADRHRKRIDHDVLGRDPEVTGGRHDLLRDREPLLRLHADLVVVRQADHRGAVPGDDRQDRLQPLVLAGDRVDERLALVGGEARFERLDHGRVDAERQIGEPLDERDGLPHQPDLVGERIADVDVEHVGAARQLLGDVDLDLREIALLQLRLECLAAGRVDPLADDAERLAGADDDGPRPRAQDGIHSSPFRCVEECRAGRRAWRCRRLGGS